MRSEGALAQSWPWLTLSSNSGHGGGFFNVKTTTDAAGNTYLAGGFRGKVRLDTATIRSSSETDSDIFVAKLNPRGRVVWAAKCGSLQTDGGRGLAVDAQGAVTITGFVGPAATFGSISSTGGIFAAHLSPQGAWQWVRVIGSNANVTSAGIAADAAGNVTVTGSFTGTITLGTSVLTTTPPNNATDAFVAQLSATGAWRWAVRAGGPGADVGLAVASTPAGELAVTGSFSSTGTFGSTQLTSAGGTDVFVARLTAAGSWQWATSGGGPEAETGQAVVIDPSGNVDLTGAHGAQAQFGSVVLTPAPGQYGLVAQISPTGTWQWAIGAGSPAEALATDAAGNLTIAATFGSRAVLPPYLLIGSGSTSAYVARINGSGVIQWVQQVNGREGIGATGVALMPSGEVLLIGNFFQEVIVGALRLGAPVPGSRNIFLARLSPSGQWQSITAADIAGYSQPTQLVIDAAGNHYLAGIFSGTLSFDSTQVISRGKNDIFLAKFNPQGRFLWITSGGGPDEDVLTGLVLDADGSPHITGTFETSALLGGTALSTGAGFAGFVARLTPNGRWRWVRQAQGTSHTYAKGLAIGADGAVTVVGVAGYNAVFGTTTLTSPSLFNLFVARLDSSGAWQWAQSPRSLPNPAQPSIFSTSGGESVDLDAAGNVFVAANLVGNVTFGSTTVSSGNGNLLVVRLNPAGSWLGVQQGSGEALKRLRVDAQGNVTVLGTFSRARSLALGSIVLNTSSGNNVAFVARLGGASAWQWAAAVQCTGLAEALDLAVGPTGEASVAGYFRGNMTLSGLQLPGPSNGYYGFVASLSPGGQWRWGAASQGDGGLAFTAVALNAAGRPAVAGSFGDLYATQALGSYVLVNHSHPQHMLLAGFVPPALPTAAQAGRAPAPGTVYPNPARTHCTFTTAAAPLARPVQVLDGLGREVRRLLLPAQVSTLALPVESLPAGMYLVRCGATASRLVVE